MCLQILQKNVLILQEVMEKLVKLLSFTTGNFFLRFVYCFLCMIFMAVFASHLTVINH